MPQRMSNGRPGSISSLMLFKAVWSPDPQVAATGTRWPGPGRYGSRGPNGLDDLSCLAGGSCIRWARPHVIPGHKAAVLCCQRRIKVLATRANFAYFARLMQFPSLGVGVGGQGDRGVPELVLHDLQVGPGSQGEGG